MPNGDKLKERHAVPTPFRQPLGAFFTNAMRKTTCVTWDAGAIPAASTFCVLASSSDSQRQIASKADTGKELVTHHEVGDSRQQATLGVMPRPPVATKSATSPLADDPDFAVVLAAWPELPHAVRAAIVATVKAAAFEEFEIRRLGSLAD